ncbi:MAG: type II secretion system F family protein [Nanoarchaeota archaeon]|nr:type II secretion system F family protein [Nanoarchaeota archaeon]MBU1855299.1 type II secretion system F family protein [Nanoarchaeota archaeon]
MIKSNNLLEKINNAIQQVYHSYNEAKRQRFAKKELKDNKEFKKTGKKFKKQKPKRRNIAILKDYLRKAGYEYADERKLSSKVMKIAILLSALFSIVVVIMMVITKGRLISTLIYLVGAWTAVFGLAIGLMWIFIYVFLDLKIFQRTKQVEDVLPDFLQLTSANISAGMPIDQALWYAVRPRFGVLAKEIEEVAKSTIAGKGLEEALKEFSDKYDSVILRRSVSLIIEGMKAGGELADLLSKIAIDIQETKLMKKEIAASIMTYVIFISFATIAAAPFLFALSTQLLQIVQGIMSSIDLTGASSGTFSISMSGDSIAIGDFKIFSVLALTVSAIFSACIVSTIQKGNIKEGMKYIPIFVIISLTLYFVANLIVSTMMSGFI